MSPAKGVDTAMVKESSKVLSKGNSIRVRVKETNQELMGKVIGISQEGIQKVYYDDSVKRLRVAGFMYKDVAINRTRLPKELSIAIDKQYIKKDAGSKRVNRTIQFGKALQDNLTKVLDELYDKDKGIVDIRRDSETNKLYLSISFDDGRHTESKRRLNYLNLRKKPTLKTEYGYSQGKLREEINLQWGRIYKKRLPSSTDLLNQTGGVVKGVKDNYRIMEYGEYFDIHVTYEITLKATSKEEDYNKVAYKIISMLLK